MSSTIGGIRKACPRGCPRDATKVCPPLALRGCRRAGVGDRAATPVVTTSHPAPGNGRRQGQDRSHLEKGEARSPRGQASAGAATCGIARTGRMPALAERPLRPIGAGGLAAEITAVLLAAANGAVAG